MKFSILFGYGSIASLALKQEFEVGNLLGINIPYCFWKKNSMFHDLRTVKIQFLEYTKI